MKLLFSLGIAAGSVLLPATNALAQHAINAEAVQKVAHSTVINRPCSSVWPLITDFGGIATWYKGFSKSAQISGPTNRVGAVRELTRASNGQSFQEKMVWLDPAGYTMAYRHIKNGPVRETINQVNLVDLNSKAQCLATWGSTFRLKADQQNDARKIRGFFIKAFEDVLADLKSKSESR